MEKLNHQITRTAQRAKAASRELALISRQKKDKALLAMAGALDKNKSAILKANQKDIVTAKKAGLSSSMIDRLCLNEKRLKAMSASLRQVAKLDDPVGEKIDTWQRPNGLLIRKVRVPIGVIAIIYESRPNVTSDCAGLCLKSGNAVILRGGKEAINSNVAIFKALDSAASGCGIPKGSINLISALDRSAVKFLLGLNGLIDLVMPRGGEGLVNLVAQFSKIPVIKHYKGVCHTYVDKTADLNMAQEVSFNAKVQRPAVCNAMETLLVHKDVAAKFLPSMIKRFKGAGVEIRGCPKTKKIVPDIKSAKEADWSLEYLDMILSVKVVNSLQDAIAHINRYGSMHSDAIITQDEGCASEFLKMVDSACVYVNSSTRFTDGGEFGFGAEIGISTEKLHARGPMALQELTTYKYHIIGNGQVRK
jgi:glutamate-5-semialdehyde dehydrogenase